MNPKPEHEHLSAWLDGELSDSEAAELEAELARDPALRAELDALEVVVSFVRQEGPAQAPMGLQHRIMARIDEEFPERSSSWSSASWSWLRRPWGIPLEGWVLAAAAAAVLLLLLPDWGQKSPSEPEEKELSPAALEVPKAVVEKEALEKPPAPGPVTVIGRASTEEGKPLKKLPPGKVASKEEPALDTKGTAEEGTPVPVPSPKLEIPAALEIPEAPEADVRYVIESDDPKMKLKMLGIASKFGGARDLQNQEVPDAIMGSSVEELLVSIPQTRLSELSRELEKVGYDFRLEHQDKIMPGGKINVRLTLSLVQPDEAMLPSPVEADGTEAAE
jgi:hypothetical protein